MSLKSLFSEPRGRAARTRGGRRGPSYSGVLLEIKGWKVGLEKVALTEFFRSVGYPLSAAALLTARLLGDDDLIIPVPKHFDIAATEGYLQEIGVAHIARVSDKAPSEQEALGAA